MFKVSSVYPEVNTNLKDALEKVTTPAPSLVPSGISMETYHYISFYILCFQDVGLDVKVSMQNKHFIINSGKASGLQFWCTGKGYDKIKKTHTNGIQEFLDHINKNYQELTSASGLFIF